MAHRLLLTARRLERLVWNGLNKGSVDTFTVIT